LLAIFANAISNVQQNPARALRPVQEWIDQ
jgi:hypothetical protein